MKVILNFALSADGKIGTSSGGSSKFTSRQDTERLWEIRKRADGLMVGRGTLEADQMTLRIPEEAHPVKQPIRICVSRKGKFSYQHPVFQNLESPLHLLSTEVPLEKVPDGVTAHHSSLQDFLQYCQETLQIQTLLCEGGGELARSLCEMGVIAEIHLTLAGHTFIGGRNAPGILGREDTHLPVSQVFQLSHLEENDYGELFLSYRRQS